MALHDDYLWTDLGMDARNRAPATSWVSGAPSALKQPPPLHPLHQQQPQQQQPPPPPPHPPQQPQQPQQPQRLQQPQHPAMHAYHASQPLDLHHRVQSQHQPQPQPSSIYASASGVYPYSALESNTRQLPHPHPVQPRHLAQTGNILNYDDAQLAPPVRHTPHPPQWVPQHQQRGYAPQEAKRHSEVAAYASQPATSAAFGSPAYNTFSGYPSVHDDAKEIMEKALQECAPSTVSSDPLGLHKGRSSLLSSVSDDLHTMAAPEMPIAFPSDPGADRGIAPPAYPPSVQGDNTATSSSIPGGHPPQPPKIVSVVGTIQKTKQRRRYAKPKSSRYCHLCARHERAVPMYPCGNLDLGICQKSVCAKCFEMYGLDLAAAKAPRTPGVTRWTCPHCQNGCPQKAKCHSYDRQTERRRMKTLAAKMGMMRANGVIPAGTTNTSVVKREATSA